jgi:hypothetical protein
MTEPTIITIDVVKTQLLGRISSELKNGEQTGFENLEPFIGAYMALCQSETMCKCPERDPFPSDIRGEM